MNIQKSTQATSIFEDQNISCLSSETRVYLSLRKSPHSEIVFVCGSLYIDCLMGKWILTVRLATLHIPLPLPQRISTGKSYVNFCVLWNFNHIWTAESSTNLIDTQVAQAALYCWVYRMLYETYFQWLISGFVARLTRRVLLVEQELPILPKHMRF